jgi:hypothetical protein
LEEKVRKEKQEKKKDDEKKIMTLGLGFWIGVLMACGINN